MHAPSHTQVIEVHLSDRIAQCQQQLERLLYGVVKDIVEAQVLGLWLLLPLLLFASVPEIHPCFKGKDTSSASAPPGNV